MPISLPVVNNALTTVVGYGWPMWFLVLPGLWFSYPRIMAIADDTVRVWAADLARTGRKKLLWSAPVSLIAVRKAAFLLKLEFTGAPHVDIDTPAGRRTIQVLGLTTSKG